MPPPDPKLVLLQIADMQDLVGRVNDIDNDDAAEFASSVANKIESMRRYIKDNDVCTPKQKTALDNMQSGLERWLHHSR